MSATVQITEIAPIGHTPPVLLVSGVRVQTGDYPGYESTVRYRVGGQWVPGAAVENINTGSGWIPVL